jgi:uncharacterized repeat protein (TIGR03803 family)
MNTSKAFLLAIAAATLAISVRAQPFRVLHGFSDSSWQTGMTNWDGSQPYETGLVLGGSTLYGTTYYGGTNGNGVVFAVNTDGSGFAVLHTFSAFSPSPDYTNTDGEAPQGSLTLVGDTLYGAAINGGMVSGGYGTIYSITTNGDTFALLHSFDSTNDGRLPNGPLVIANGKIYGTAELGGTGGNGTVFSMDLDGSQFTVLHPFTNVDGDFPNGLVLSGDTLYGNTFLGGISNNGTMFSINTNGSNFTVLHSFTRNGAEGDEPWMPPVIFNNTIYGASTFDGPNGSGALFSMSTNGDNITVLHTFSGMSGLGYQFNYDGSGPMGISVSNGVLYGVTEDGGGGGDGVVYLVNTDGTDFTVLHTLAAESPYPYSNYDGAFPEGPLVLSGNTLYGTAEQGGNPNGSGTVFAVTIVPDITGLGLAGTNLVLNGINGIAGESCTIVMSANLALPISQWTPVATNVLSGNSFTITATNAVDPSAPQRFYTIQLR